MVVHPSAPCRMRGVHLLPTPVCPSLDGRIASTDHPAVHRSVLAEEPGDVRRQRHPVASEDRPVAATGASPPGTLIRNDGRPGLIERPATIIQDGPPLRRGNRLVIQVSRWDRLKDMRGVMKGFALALSEHVDAHLALVRPRMDAVSDDPEGIEAYDECVSAWETLDSESRRRVRPLRLPMEDVDGTRRW